MRRELELEEKLRKSEVLSEEDIYHDFMKYASQVSDQLAVYAYMEENQIGIDITQYWLARFKAMRRHCQLVLLAQLINQVRYGPDIQEHLISEFALKLTHDLRNLIMENTSTGRRKIQTFRLLEKQKIEHRTRKIGNIEVYVDSPNRKIYSLEDYAEYIEKELPDACSIERQCYLREQSLKPPSFLTKKEQSLLNLAEELIVKRNSFNNPHRRTANNIRFSHPVHLKSVENRKQEQFNTPKIVEVIGTTKSKLSKSDLKRKMASDRSRDSVQIMKDIMMKRQSENYRSPKFGERRQKSQQKQIFTQSSQYERCRAAFNNDRADESFSFGKKRRSHYEVRQRWTSQHKRDNSEEDRQTMNNAFIIYSFSKQNNQNNNSGEQQDFQLQLLINTCQKQGCSRTITSGIDSNQQNINPYDRLNLPQFPEHKDRKPFEVLLQTQSYQIKDTSSIKLQDIIDIDHERNPETGFETGQSGLVQHSEHKPKQNRYPNFFSERKANEHVASSRSWLKSSRRG